ncbi:hypothetical protein WI26_07190 [Burkholderia diffusa]|nr:hypothetical protein WI26_07190 [Burkholderia diffusa]
MMKQKPADERAFLHPGSSKKMSFVQSTILSSAWWVSSAVGVVILGLFGMYIKDGLDKLAKRAWGKWTLRSKAARESFEAQVALLQTDPGLRDLCFQAEMRGRHRATLATIQAVSGLLIMLFSIATHYAAKHGLMGDVSAFALVAVQVFGVFSGLLSIVCIASATVTIVRCANMSERLHAAQLPRTDERGAA